MTRGAVSLLATGAVLPFRVRVMYGAPKIHFLFAGGWQVGDPSRGADDDLDGRQRLRQPTTQRLDSQLVLDRAGKVPDIHFTSKQYT